MRFKGDWRFGIREDGARIRVESEKSPGLKSCSMAGRRVGSEVVGYEATCPSRRARRRASDKRGRPAG